LATCNVVYPMTNNQFIWHRSVPVEATARPVVLPCDDMATCHEYKAASPDDYEGRSP
jgi:hypothetical protein